MAACTSRPVAVDITVQRKLQVDARRAVELRDVFIQARYGIPDDALASELILVRWFSGLAPARFAVTV